MKLNNQTNLKEGKMLKIKANQSVNLSILNSNGIKTVLVKSITVANGLHLLKLQKITTTIIHKYKIKKIIKKDNMNRILQYNKATKVI